MEHQSVEYFSAYKTLNQLTEVKELQDLLKVEKIIKRIIINLGT
jgi:hypothetical protein